MGCYYSKEDDQKEPLQRNRPTSTYLALALLNVRIFNNLK